MPDALSGVVVARFLNRELVGRDITIERPGDLEECGPGEIVWIRQYAPESVKHLNERCPALVICEATTARHLTVPHVVSDRPRLDFIRIIREFFAEESVLGIHPTALVDPGARLGREIVVGAFARIGPYVSIGDCSQIGSGVVIEGQVVIGRRCRIKSNSVLGAPGFGFERDENGVPIHFPHVGRIVLEDDVWIGACSTVERATLGTTRLCKGVKVDDLVQIGHNTRTGANTLIMANTVICGGARIGERCWIAPNSVIKEKVVIGDDVKVGLGAVVLSNVDNGLVVAGVPAKPLTPNRSSFKTKDQG